MSQFVRRRIPFKYFTIASRFWPPFFGAGIRVIKLTPDFRECETRMKLHWYNKNWVGTHYGGSIFSMTDPFYMVMLINILGKDYLVWDSSACIEYLKPGKTEVSAQFKISDELLEEIVKKTSDGSAQYFKFDVDVVDANGEVVAKVDKNVYIRKKKGR